MAVSAMNVISRFCGQLLHNRNDIRHRLAKLETIVNGLQQLSKQQENPDYHVSIDQVYIEKIVVDKLELNNNFGTLGIKELQGTLNIGANYGFTRAPRSGENKQQGDDTEKAKPSGSPSLQQRGPKCSITFGK